jgi:hypothetical protein
MENKGARFEFGVILAQTVPGTGWECGRSVLEIAWKLAKHMRFTRSKVTVLYKHWRKLV